MNIQEAKTHLSRLVDRAAAGEEIVIAKAGKPLAKLVPYTPVIQPRTGGFLAGRIWEAPDCWEEDEDLAALLTQSPLLPEPVSMIAEDPLPYRTKTKNKQ